MDVGFDPRSATRVVSIHFYGRSGSIFLQSLLDWHPDVLTFPADTLRSFFQFWQRCGELPPLELIAAFVDAYDILFDPTTTTDWLDVPVPLGEIYGFSKMGENRDESLGVDLALFKDQLLKKLTLVVADFAADRVERKFFFQAIHVAYAEALGRDLEAAQPVIVYQAHVPDYSEIRDLISDFPAQVHFLHTPREPVQTLGSWYLQMRAMEKGARLDLAQRTLERSLETAQFYGRLLADA